VDGDAVDAAVRTCAEPGNASAAHTSRPAASVMTCTFTPRRRCLLEWWALVSDLSQAPDVRWLRRTDRGTDQSRPKESGAAPMGGAAAGSGRNPLVEVLSAYLNSVEPPT